MKKNLLSPQKLILTKENLKNFDQIYGGNWIKTLATLAKVMVDFYTKDVFATCNSCNKDCAKV